jgi:3-hydroxymyristoyl/3-hydroxydecanoyl-(acyl carrier protein) dehydratase
MAGQPASPRKAVNLVAAMTGTALIILGTTVQNPIVGGIEILLILAGATGFLVRGARVGPG